jgi:hypothetical protein
MHQLKYGDSADRIRKMAKRSGGSVSIPDPPQLTAWEALLYTAFAELSTDRQLGMAEGPIPWSSIRRYAHEYGFDLSDLSDILRRVDGAYLRHQAAKLEKRSGRSQKQ